jgi:uncharacterized membrane protein
MKSNRSIATSVLVSAVGLSLVAGLTPTSAAENATMQQKLEQMLKMHPGASKETIEANMKRVAKNHLARCYGINAVAKNDCASGAHSCSGQSTMARDPSAFVLLPAGDCAKIAGGSTKGPM